MNISRLFIERPIMTVLVCFAIVLFGTVAFRALPVAALPSVDYPTIQVTAALPGRQPRNHGVHRRHAAGASVLHHRGNLLDEFDEYARRHRHHGAVHIGP